MNFKALSLIFPLKSAIEEAQAFVDDVSFRHDIPHGKNVPADLADKEGTWQLNSNGYPVAGQVLMDDIGVGSLSPALPLYLGMYAFIAVLVGLLPLIGLGFLTPFILLAYFFGFALYFGFSSMFLFAVVTVGASTVLLPLIFNSFLFNSSLIGIKPTAVQLVFNVIPAIAPFIYYVLRVRNRASELAYQGTTYARAIIRSPKAFMNEERHIQALNADEDKSPMIIFGTATGALSFNGDSYAPDKGLPVAMSEEDMSTHMQVFGSTGTGKTTELRTILKSIAN